MPNSYPQLDQWLHRVQQVKSSQEIFKLLDEFRTSPPSPSRDWTDEELALMSKTYIRHLERIKEQDSSTTARKSSSAGQESDGPVWYEKM